MKNNEKPYVIGLDLGGTNSVFGIVDANAKVIAETKVKTQGHGTVEQYVADCVEALNVIIKEVGGIEKIKGMGIGAPNGNYYTGCVEFAPNLPWKDKIPLAQLFSDALGIPVTLTNDANAAAIGEMTYGAAKGMKNFIMITIGTGVGSGIVCDGKLVYGHDGMAGELGHVVVDRNNGRLCGCGRRGCLETYCSATGIVRTAKELMATTDTPTTLRNIPEDFLECKDVAVEAAKGDLMANEILEKTGALLGAVCADFACFNSPEAFIFFGGPMAAGELLMAPIRRSYHQNILKCFKGKAKFLISQLDGAQAAVLGASALAW